jgi:hypothetical protein
VSKSTSFPVLAPPSARRIVAATCVVVASLAWIGRAFWEEDLRWSMPTPRPADVVQPDVGARIATPAALAGLVDEGVPTLLHFFNPTCPCSRFNVDHVRDLVQEYGARTRVVVVLQGESEEKLERAFRGLDLDARHVVDRDAVIARAYGVYSTPQAVVLDRSGAIAYRGNYNVSRFCIEPATQFVRCALEDVVEHRPVRALDTRATIAYGCALPSVEGGFAP